MSTTATIVSLNSKVAIYVPVRLAATYSITSYLAHIAGGATVIRGRGAWKQEDGLIEYEDIDIISVYHAADKREEISSCLHDCARLLLELNEQAVMIEHDGVAEIISEVTT